MFFGKNRSRRCPLGVKNDTANADVAIEVAEFARTRATPTCRILANAATAGLSRAKSPGRGLFRTLPDRTAPNSPGRGLFRTFPDTRIKRWGVRFGANSGMAKRDERFRFRKLSAGQCVRRFRLCQ